MEKYLVYLKFEKYYNNMKKINEIQNYYYFRINK